MYWRSWQHIVLIFIRESYIRTREQWESLSLEDLENVVFYRLDSSRTATLETARLHGLELLLSLQEAVQGLERKLGITQRWTEGSEGWKEATRDEAVRAYQRALDHLERLVVQRLFELTKLNHAGTGYKLRTHIAKALKARSQAVRNAVKGYNDAATSLSPPRQALEVGEVLDYVFLGQFDILRDSSHGIQEKVWTRPAQRVASDMYFKIARAREELVRLDIEAHWLQTYIRDRSLKVQRCINELALSNPTLAHQLQLRHRAVKDRT